jgi:hypothetical protein
VTSDVRNTHSEFTRPVLSHCTPPRLVQAFTVPLCTAARQLERHEGDVHVEKMSLSVAQSTLLVLQLNECTPTACQNRRKTATLGRDILARMWRRWSHCLRKASLASRAAKELPRIITVSTR